MPISSQGAVDLGVRTECWLVKFDKHGECISPKTREALLERLKRDQQAPVIMFSHGWNNDFNAATDSYQRFLREFEAHVRAQHSELKPVFIGILWPSIWLSFDEGLQLAGLPDVDTQNVEQGYISEVASVLQGGADRERFYALMESERLDESEGRELASLLSRALQDNGPFTKATVDDWAAPGAADLFAALRGNPAPGTGAEELDFLPEGGTVDGKEVAPEQVAGGLRFLDPRWALRIASVYQMKDRAGIVGMRGVSRLLAGVLQTGHAVHLVGHSYGCKVMLSALVHIPASETVSSALLLQPAISHLAFASELPGADGKGGYHEVPARITRSLAITYSANDTALHKLFHLALRREHDIGEIGFAAAGAGQPPNKYAALGGYGPRGANEALHSALPSVGEFAELSVGGRPLAFDGSAGQIKGHGDVTNALTAWLLFLQMRNG